MLQFQINKERSLLLSPGESQKAVPGWARWRWEWWELWTDPVGAPLKGDQAERHPGPGSCIHPSQLKPSPAASLQD